MRVLLFLTVFLLAQILVLPQSVDKELQIEQVRTIVGSLVARSEDAEIMLRDLSELRGSVKSLAYESFTVKIKGRYGERVLATIAYRDVLVIKSKKASISFIPDPTLRSYGSWDDVARISYNNYLEVVLENGRSVTGRTGEITKDELTLFTQTDNEKLILPRDQITFVYRVRYQFDKTGDGVSGGARKGGNIGREIGPTATGKILGAGLGTVIGAGIGAVSGASKKEEKLRVLIYSK